MRAGPVAAAASITSATASFGGIGGVIPGNDRYPRLAAVGRASSTRLLSARTSSTDPSSAMRRMVSRIVPAQVRKMRVARVGQEAFETAHPGSGARSARPSRLPGTTPPQYPDADGNYLRRVFA